MADCRGDIRTGGLLPVLQRASHDELNVVVEALDRSWDVRIKADDRFRRAQHKLTIIPHVIEEYLLRAGGNSFRNWWRGGGPPYAEVVRDICGIMGAQVGSADSVLQMEETLLKTVVERVWSELSPKQREDIARAAEIELDMSRGMFEEKSGSNLWMLPLSMLAAQIGARLTRFIVYQVALQVSQIATRQLFGQGLRLAAGAALTRVIAVAIGPIGWVASATWMAVDLAGPSYRGLAPAVFQVAVLRQQMLWSDVRGNP